MSLKRHCGALAARFVRLVLVLTGVLAGVGALGIQAKADASLRVYMNVDLTHTYDVGENLVLGLRSGLQEGARQFGGPSIEVLVQDHKNNLRRTARTLSDALQDPQTLAMVGGMQSPHYIKHGPMINERGLVLLLPWSAGGGLTRMAQGTQNHIFRVSVDDRKAAPYLAQQSASFGCKRVATLALDNGWGRGNSRSLSQILPHLGLDLVQQSFVRRNAGVDTVRATLRDMTVKQPDCMVFVLAGRVSAYAANALAEWDTPPNVISHWGVLGGGYREAVMDVVWDRVNFAILSTCVLDIERARPDQVARALNAARAFAPDLRALTDLKSPPAFAHAYDVGLLLRAAAAQAGSDPRWADGPAARNAALRDALHTLKTPVNGVLKTYDRPFSMVSDTMPDGHEALGTDDLCLVQMLRNGGLSPFEGEVGP